MHKINFELPLPVTVKLAGENGNAFNIIGRTTSEMRRQLRKAGWNHKDIEAVCSAYQIEATAGDYDNVLSTTMRYVEVE